MIVKSARKATRLAKRRWRMGQLAREGSREMGMLAQAVRKTVAGSPSTAEITWIDRIEALRQAMNASEERITRLDYGAGDSDSNRSTEAMEAGVQVTSTLGQISEKLSKPSLWCLLLFNLVRSFKPHRCLEMGTAVGISAAYQAAAIALNGSGNLTTLEGAPTLADIANKNLGQLGLQNVDVVVGRFEDTLQDVLRRQAPVDFAFVDGHHDEEATLKYFDDFCGFVAGNALLVFDDIAWSSGMKRAWRTIQDDSRISAAIDLGPVGVCVITESEVQRTFYDLPLQ